MTRAASPAQDLPRTFPDHPWLRSEHGRSALRNILTVYARQSPQARRRLRARSRARLRARDPVSCSHPRTPLLSRRFAAKAASNALVRLPEGSRAPSAGLAMHSDCAP